MLLLNLHRDEWTSLAAASRVQGDADLCWLDHPGGRNVFVRADEKNYAFDPNRMFTDVGLARSMASLNEATVPPDIITKVRGEAIALVRETRMDARRVVVALHNNSEDQYSAASYLPGAVYAADADSVYLPAGSDPDDFFFVTERPLFDALAGGDMAVVLQNNATVTDDGSLSVYCARNGIRYVNVEAQHGHLEQQVAMLETLFAALRRLDGP